VKIASAFVEIRADTSKVQPDLDKMERQVTGSAQSAASGFARAFATVAIGAGIKKSIDAATQLEQAVGGTTAVFQENAGVVEDWAKSADEAVGLSERAAREFTSQIGAALQGYGFAVDEAADKSIELTTLGADLAATFGGTVPEAVTALSAALRGEFDPLERYGVSLRASDIAARAVKDGLAETESTVSNYAKAQAALTIITEQSANAQGQFAREAGSAAGAAEISAAKAENAAASMGDNLLPVYTKVVEVLGTLADAFGALPGSVQTGIVALAGVAVVAKPIRDAFGALKAGGEGALAVLRRLGPTGSSSASGLAKLGGALGGLGFVAAVGGAAYFANKLNDVKVDVDSMAAALGNLTNANREAVMETLIVSNAFGDLDEVVKQLANENVPAAQRFVDFATEAGLAGDEVAKLQKIIDDKRGSDVQGAKDQETYRKEIEQTEPPVRDLTKALDDQVRAIEDVIQATIAQFDSNVAYRRSVDSVEDALTKVNEAQKEHGRNSEEYRDASLDAESALLDQADAAVRLYEDTVQAAGGTLDASEKAAIYKVELERLAQTLSPRSPLRAQIEGYIGQLNEVPDQIRTSILVEAGGSFETVKELLAYLDAIASHSIVTHTQLLDFKQERLLARQHGGPFEAGDCVRLGEDGPEVVQFGQSGTVIQNGDGFNLLGEEQLLTQREMVELLRRLVAAASSSSIDAMRALQLELT
jgi:hypothetical protein